MRIEYDADADAAYVYLCESIPPGGVESTVAVDGPVASGIQLDFDADRGLLGVEILDASRRLPRELLEQAAAPPEV